MSNKTNQMNKTQEVKEVRKMTEFKFKTSAFKTKDNKKFIFNLDGHKYMLAPTTPEDYMYSGIRSNYKIVEIIEKGDE